MNIARRQKLALLIALLAFALFACDTPAFLEEEEPLYIPPNPAVTQPLVIDALWQEVNDGYLHADFGGADWEAVNQQYLDELSPGLSAGAFHQLLEKMVAEIPDSGIELRTRQERIDQAGPSPLVTSGLGPFIAVRDGADEGRRLIVLDIVPGSAADQAGLRPHDAILSIDNQPIPLNDGASAVKQLSGASGTSLQMVVRSPLEEPRIVTLTRRNLESAAGELEYTVLPDTNVLYILFPSQESRNILNEFSNALDLLQTLDEQNQGLILDFRRKTGQRRTALPQLLTLFANGDIATRNNRGQLSPVTIEGVPSPLQSADQVKVAILVGPETAGPAELFAAALQDLGRATVIGQTTSGTLEAFQGSFLPNGTQLLLPTSTFITLNGQRDLGRLGLEPDIIVASSWDEVSATADPLIDQALKTIRESNE